MKDLHSAIKTLELPKNTAIVLEYLIENGEYKAMPLARAVGVHKQSVYAALEELELEGIVKRVMKNDVAHFRVAQVRSLLESAKQRVKAAEVLVRSAAQKQSKSDSSVVFYEGIEGVHAFTNGVLNESQTLHVLGANFRFRELYPEIFDYWVERWSRKKEKIHLLIPEAKKQEKVPGVLVRSLNIRAYDGVTWILDKSIAHVVWTSKEQTEITVIRNQQLAMQHQNFFDALWKGAKKM